MLCSRERDSFGSRRARGARRSFVGQKIGWTPVRVNRTPGPLSPYRFEACTQGHSGSVRQVQPRSWPLKVERGQVIRPTASVYRCRRDGVHPDLWDGRARDRRNAASSLSIHRSRTVWAAPWPSPSRHHRAHRRRARPPGGAMLAATRTFARVRAASAPEAAISLRRFAAPAGAAAGPSDASGAPPSRGTPFPPPPRDRRSTPPLPHPSRSSRIPPRLAVPPLTPPLLVPPPPRRVAQPPTRRRSPPTSPPRRRLPADPPRRAALAAGSPRRSFARRTRASRRPTRYRTATPSAGTRP